MRNRVSRILAKPHRNRKSEPGASPQEIDRLRQASPHPLPNELVELLEVSNGGEGNLGLPSLLLLLDRVEEIVAGFSDPFLIEHFPGFTFIGGNGGLERIALDCRSGRPPFPVVMINPIAGPESAEVIAPDVAAFVAAIGQEYFDREPCE